MKIPRSFQYPKKPKTVAQRLPTGVKMTPKTTSRTPSRYLADKIEILQKPLYLLWFKHIQPLHSGNISLPGLPKRWIWKLSPTLAPQITENQPIVPKVCPRKFPKWNQKSIKIDIWPSVCPLDAPLDPMITTMVPQVSKIQPGGVKMQTLHLNFSVQIVTIWRKVHQTNTKRLRCKPCILTFNNNMATICPKFPNKPLKA
jgi:hypothetical protein